MNLFYFGIVFSFLTHLNWGGEDSYYGSVDPDDDIETQITIFLHIDAADAESIEIIYNEINWEITNECNKVNANQIEEEVLDSVHTIYQCNIEIGIEVTLMCDNDFENGWYNTDTYLSIGGYEFCRDFIMGVIYTEIGIFNELLEFQPYGQLTIDSQDDEVNLVDLNIEMVLPQKSARTDTCPQAGIENDWCWNEVFTCESCCSTNHANGIYCWDANTFTSLACCGAEIQVRSTTTSPTPLPTDSPTDSPVTPPAALDPFCVTADVGPSISNNEKTIILDEVRECPTTVSQDNWLSEDSYSDTFEVIQRASQLTIRRSDLEGGWGIDLQFECCGPLVEQGEAHFEPLYDPFIYCKNYKYLGVSVIDRKACHMIAQEDEDCYNYGMLIFVTEPQGPCYCSVDDYSETAVSSNQQQVYEVSYETRFPTTAPTPLCQILLVGAPCIENTPEAVDIVALMDSSSSIDDDDYYLFRDSMAKVVNGSRFTVNEDSRFAFAMFSTYTEVRMPLQNLTRHAELAEEILQQQRMEGATFLENALIRIKRDIWDLNLDPHRTQNTIIVTDGIPSTGQDPCHLIPEFHAQGLGFVLVTVDAATDNIIEHEVNSVFSCFADSGSTIWTEDNFITASNRLGEYVDPSNQCGPLPDTPFDSQYFLTNRTVNGYPVYKSPKGWEALWDGQRFTWQFMDPARILGYMFDLQLSQSMRPETGHNWIYVDAELVQRQINSVPILCLERPLQEFTDIPTFAPSTTPSVSPETSNPTTSPTPRPTSKPTDSPTNSPSPRPSPSPTLNPSPGPTPKPTTAPTPKPTGSPTLSPTNSPTNDPTTSPSPRPTNRPSSSPTNSPTDVPTPRPTNKPTSEPSPNPTPSPTRSPSANPTPSPTNKPSTLAPSTAPVIDDCSTFVVGGDCYDENGEREYDECTFDQDTPMTGLYTFFDEYYNGKPIYMSVEYLGHPAGIELYFEDGWEFYVPPKEFVYESQPDSELYNRPLGGWDWRKHGSQAQYTDVYIACVLPSSPSMTPAPATSNPSPSPTPGPTPSPTKNPSTSPTPRPTSGPTDSPVTLTTLSPTVANTCCTFIFGSDCEGEGSVPENEFECTYDYLTPFNGRYTCVDGIITNGKRIWQNEIGFQMFYQSGFWQVQHINVGMGTIGLQQSNIDTDSSEPPTYANWMFVPDASMFLIVPITCTDDIDTSSNICDLTLVQQTSRTNCIYDVNFGCEDESAIFVTAGCQGDFTIHDEPISCASVNSQRQVCRLDVSSTTTTTMNPTVTTTHDPNLPTLHPTTFDLTDCDEYKTEIIELRRRVNDLEDTMQQCVDIQTQILAMEITMENTQIAVQVIYYCFQRPEDPRCSPSSFESPNVAMAKLVYCFDNPTDSIC